MTLVVTGPPSCGTRLLVRVLRAGGLDPIHDQAHGLDGDVLRAAEAVVAVVRDRTAAEASLAASQLGETALDLWPFDECVAAIQAAAPDAVWVSYEQLCDDPSGVVAVLADRLDVEAWTVAEEIVSQNAKWAAGGGPQIGDLHPDQPRVG